MKKNKSFREKFESELLENQQYDFSILDINGNLITVAVSKDGEIVFSSTVLLREFNFLLKILKFTKTNFKMDLIGCLNKKRESERLIFPTKSKISYKI